jgi:hypothetical protein
MALGLHSIEAASKIRRDKSPSSQSTYFRPSFPTVVHSATPFPAEHACSRLQNTITTRPISLRASTTHAKRIPLITDFAGDLPSSTASRLRNNRLRETKPRVTGCETTIAVFTQTAGTEAWETEAPSQLLHYKASPLREKVMSSRCTFCETAKPTRSVLA